MLRTEVKTITCSHTLLRSNVPNLVTPSKHVVQINKTKKNKTLTIQLKHLGTEMTLYSQSHLIISYKLQSHAVVWQLQPLSCILKNSASLQCSRVQLLSPGTIIRLISILKEGNQMPEFISYSQTTPAGNHES